MTAFLRYNPGLTTRLKLCKQAHKTNKTLYVDRGANIYISKPSPQVLPTIHLYYLFIQTWNPTSEYITSLIFCLLSILVVSCQCRGPLLHHLQLDLQHLKTIDLWILLALARAYYLTLRQNIYIVSNISDYNLAAMRKEHPAEGVTVYSYLMIIRIWWNREYCYIRIKGISR